MEQMKALLGMYSLRRWMAEDLTGALGEAQRLGFDGIELAWYAGHPVAKVRQAVKDIGLDVWSCHTDVQEMLTGGDALFEDVASFGARYVIICHMTEEQRPGGAAFEKTVEQVARLSQRAREQYGLTMLYHNHDFDLKIMPDGRRSLDHSYEAFDVLGELDTCWVELCGASTVDYLQRYAGRIPLMHIKDFRHNAAASGLSSPAPGAEFCPLGMGALDFEAIFAAAQATGVKGTILEIDEPGSGYDARQCVELGAKKMMQLLGR